MNLISEPWIPIRRADGSRGKIAPWQLTEDIDDPARRIVSIASPRPDFDGALVQFLIGLLQTTCSPPTEDDWWDWQEKPPIGQELLRRFGPFERAFQLDASEGPIFMQERLSAQGQGNEHPSSYLLIGAPTKNTEDQNIDHFQKRSPRSQGLCVTCAASALFTLQTFAPSGGGGGEGKFTGLRGGGPLTIMILGKSLWETVWLNVIVGGPFSVREPTEKTFPAWEISKFLTDGVSVRTIDSNDMNPEHVFWGMPRRIELVFENTDGKACCALCGETSDNLCFRYRDKDGGLTYQRKVGSGKKPSWIDPRHPLSPYTIGKDKSPSAVHPQPGFVAYRHWLGLVENSQQGDVERKVAAVIDQFRLLSRQDGQMWAFGFDMDNMKARSWQDSTMPIYHFEKEALSAEFASHVTDMVKGARYVSGLVLSAVMRATVLEVKKEKADNGHLRIKWKWPRDVLGKLKRSTEKAESVEQKVNDSGEELEGRISDNLLSGPMAARAQFWSMSENDFYVRTKALRQVIVDGASETEVLKNWLSDLTKAAETVFSDFTQMGDFDMGDPRRAALAHSQLMQELRGKYLRNMLRLP